MLVTQNFEYKTHFFTLYISEIFLLHTLSSLLWGRETAPMDTALNA